MTKEKCSICNESLNFEKSQTMEFIRLMHGNDRDFIQYVAGTIAYRCRNCRELVCKSCAEKYACAKCGKLIFNKC